VPTANNEDHLSALITFKFSAKITHSPEILTPGDSTLTGVVATWPLGGNHPMLWLIVSSGKNYPTL